MRFACARVVLPNLLVLHIFISRTMSRQGSLQDCTHLNAHLLIVILGIGQACAPDNGELVPQQDLDQVKLLIVHEGHQGGLCFSLSVVLNSTGRAPSDGMDTFCKGLPCPSGPQHRAEECLHEPRSGRAQDTQGAAFLVWHSLFV